MDPSKRENMGLGSMHSGIEYALLCLIRPPSCSLFPLTFKHIKAVARAAAEKTTFV